MGCGRSLQVLQICLVGGILRLLFYMEMMAKGVKFTLPPTEEEGATLARFLDSEGVECGVSGK